MDILQLIIDFNTRVETENYFDEHAAERIMARILTTSNLGPLKTDPELQQFSQFLRSYTYSLLQELQEIEMDVEEENLSSQEFAAIKQIARKYQQFEYLSQALQKRMQY